VLHGRIQFKIRLVWGKNKQMVFKTVSLFKKILLEFENLPWICLYLPTAYTTGQMKKQ